jgi:hypothetical protein
MSWAKETWKELSIWVKNILKVKDAFIALQFVAICIGAVSHLKTCKALDNDDVTIKRVRHERDSASRKADSCNARIINFKYGN